MYTRSPSILIRSRICKIFAPNRSVSSSKSYIIPKRQICMQIWVTLPNDDNGGPLGAKMWCILVRLIYSEMLILCLLALVTFFITILGATQRDRFEDFEVRPYRQNSILATSFWNVDRSCDIIGFHSNIYSCCV